ncbi:MAG: DUF4831 family protein [Paludibacter sp.]|nr:DUF4831 family protein [Paludibacter sp.]MDD4198488.1 DUF4831 family protein [Paludibacter sp.]MDD4427601.1 DUF4831 family protein [Paludibacter sp.]
MKKLIVISLLFIGITGIKAQSAFTLTEGVPAIVYALPKTELCFNIEVETTVEKPGVFYLYSQRYLATSQVVMEEKIASKITGIKITTRTVPDPARKFAVEPLTKAPLNGIVVNEQGILCGVNVPVVLQQQFPEKSESAAKNTGSELPTTGLLPLTQEYMMAGSTAKMAEGAAKQIYDIRESRLNLLAGEMDHLPDGNALSMMLNGLDRKEKELTELFVGSVKKEINSYTLYFTPNKVISEEVLFRLSANRGVVSKDDLSGEPFFITISPEKIQLQEGDSKKKQEKAGLFTVLPAMTVITISDGVNTILERTFHIPQFGELVSLPESLLRTPGIIITVDRSTGRLLGIEK